MAGKQLASRMAAVGLAATVAAPQAAQATAFQLREGSAIAIGSALAGRTANDSDVSLSIQNPATLSGVRSFAVSAGAAALFPSSDAAATGFQLVNPGPPPAFAPVGGTDNPNEAAFIPSFALGYRLSPQWVVGFALKAPFGLATEYDSSFPTAYDGTRSELTTISATPQVAWTPTPGFTLGAGLTFQYADAELKTNIGALDPRFPDDFSISGDGYAFGYTLGALIEPVEGTRIGVNFQSGFSHTLEGNFSDNFPGNGGANAEAEFDLPTIISFGVIQDVNARLRIMGEVEFTGWSGFESIRIRNTDTGALVEDDAQGYENSIMVSVGAEYDLTDRWTVRAGAAYDQSPTTDDLRSQRTPDSDRYWLAAGASYALTETISVDGAYLFILGKDTTIADSESRVPGSTVRVTNGSVHLLQVNVSYSF